MFKIIIPTCPKSSVDQNVSKLQEDLKNVARAPTCHRRSWGRTEPIWPIHTPFKHGSELLARSSDALDVSSRRVARSPYGWLGYANLIGSAQVNEVSKKSDQS